MSQRSSGFTLIEMVVVVAIIIALAGILVPIVTGELEDAKVATAQATVNRVATALTQYLKDTSFAPTGQNGQKTYHYLYGDGTVPSANKFASGQGALLSDFLTENTTQTTGWKGPYLQRVEADPWGCAYLVNSNSFFKSTERAWVLSAGPDRTVNTTAASTVPLGDDIAIFVK